MGIYETDGLTSLNYCNMPATVISVGFMSNDNDDLALSTEDYKKKMALGIAKGIDEYFEKVDSQE
jgi:N-acetylmuramoyl-L-alanine amidase